MDGLSTVLNFGSNSVVSINETVKLPLHICLIFIYHQKIIILPIFAEALDNFATTSIALIIALIIGILLYY